MHGSRTGRIAMAVLLAAFAACSDDTTDPASITDFSATLNGASVKPNATTSTATASATFSYSGGNIVYDIDYTGLSVAPTAAHIHVGGPTSGTGAVQLNLCGAGAAPACPGTTAGSISGTATPAYLAAGVTMDQVVSNMRGFNAYVNIHITAGAVEIRGNIVGVP